MHFVSETSIIAVTVMHRLATAVKLDSSLHFFYLRHLTLKDSKQNPNTCERDPTLAVGFFSCGGQNQNSELDSTVGSGRKAPIHEKCGTTLVSTTATLWAACCCYQAMFF